MVIGILTYNPTICYSYVPSCVMLLPFAGPRFFFPLRYEWLTKNQCIIANRLGVKLMTCLTYNVFITLCYTQEYHLLFKNVIYLNMGSINIMHVICDCDVLMCSFFVKWVVLLLEVLNHQSLLREYELEVLLYIEYVWIISCAYMWIGSVMWAV